MEDNRQKALERRNQRRQMNTATTGTSTRTGPQPREHVLSNPAGRETTISGAGPHSVANSSTYKCCTTTNYSNVAKTSDQSQSRTHMISTISKSKTNSGCQNYLGQVHVPDRENCKGANDSKMPSSKHWTNSSSSSGNFSHSQPGFHGGHRKEVSKEQKPSAPFNCPSEKAIKGMCVLLSRKRFSVNVGYHAQLIGIFKTIPSRSYGKLLQRPCTYHCFAQGGRQG